VAFEARGELQTRFPTCSPNTGNFDFGAPNTKTSTAMILFRDASSGFSLASSLPIVDCTSSP
jgi:hypothetical protein